MAKFNFKNIDNFKSNNSSTSYFKLENHKDSAKVRFLLNSIDDLELFSVHRIENKVIDCLGDNCPLCKSGDKPRLKTFIPIYNLEANALQMWERSKLYAEKIAGFDKRYGKKGLFNHVFEIERNGAKGDRETKYEIFPIDREETDRSKLPEVTTVLGGMVKEMNAKEMKELISQEQIDNNPKPKIKKAQSKPVINELLEEDSDDLPF